LDIFSSLIRLFGGRVWIKRALRRGPEPALYASLDVDCRIARRQTRAKLSSTTESSIAGRRTTETIRKNDRDVRGRRRGSPAVVPVVDRQLDRRARPLRSRQGDSDEGGGRRTWAEMDSKSISACRSTQRRSRRQTGRLRRASEPQREKTNPVIAWISLYSLVAVGLPHHHGVGVGGLAGGDHRGPC
jgi:hypothetical protein